MLCDNLNGKEIQKGDICMREGFPDGSAGKESACIAGFIGDSGSIPGRAWQPTPVFLPGESHGLRSLEGLQSMGSQKSDMTDLARMHDVHRMWCSI